MGPDKNKHKLANSTIVKNVVKFFMHLILLDRLLIFHACILNCVTL